MQPSNRRHVVRYRDHQPLWTPAREPDKVAQHDGLMSRPFNKVEIGVGHRRLQEEQMSEFAKGDTVRLKSGGPVMTVTDVGDGTLDKNLVWTVWFSGAVKQDATFPAEVVEKVSRPGRTTVDLI